MTTNGGEQLVVARESAALIWTLIAPPVGLTAGIAVALLIVAAVLSVR
jgi:hypothetical protein